MKDPKFGSNEKQSFVELETNLGKIRIVAEGDDVFITNPDGDVISRTSISGKTNQKFSGTISLSRNLTHYSTKTIDSAVEIALADNPIIGGSAEIRLIGDGATTPTFSSDFTKSVSSDDYDNTASTVNKIVFYYDGTEAFYSITVLS